MTNSAEWVEVHYEDEISDVHGTRLSTTSLLNHMKLSNIVYVENTPYEIKLGPNGKIFIRPLETD